MKQRLLINDFKVFENQFVTLKSLTVLAGSNSVGKSTIIQSLLLIRTTWEEYNKLTDKNEHFNVSLNGPFLLELGNTFEVVRRGLRIAESNISFVLSDDADEVIASVLLYGDRTANNVYQLNAKKILFSAIDTGILNKKFYYLCAERIGPRLKYEYEVIPFLHAGYRGERSFQILSGENMPVDNGKLFGTDKEGLLFEQVRKWLDYIIPGASFDNAIPIGRSRSIEGSFSESLPTNVGFGISYVLPIILNGLLAETTSILIVENPEAHLHPSGQSRIGRFLAKVAGAGTQVILETHSEHVVNGIRIATGEGTISHQEVIINFVQKQRKGNSKITEIDLNDLGDLTNYPTGFFDQEQSDIAELIINKRKTLKID